MLSRILIRSCIRRSCRKPIQCPVPQCRRRRLYASQGAAERVEEEEEEDFRLIKSTETHDQVRANLPGTTLGRPSNVLILRDAVDTLQTELEKDGQTISQVEKEVDSSVEGDTTAEILEALEQPIQHDSNVPEVVAQDVVNEHLDKIRPRVTSGMVQPALHSTQADRLVKEISDMFAPDQLKTYYDLRSSQSKISWLPWQYQKSKPPKMDDAETLATLIVYGLWEVAVHQKDPIVGHALYPLSVSQHHVLAGNSFEHPTRIAHTWNIQFQALHQKSDDTYLPALLWTGPQNSVKHAWADLESLLSSIKTDILDLRPFVQDGVDSNEYLENISQHELNQITHNTGIALSKSLSQHNTPELIISALHHDQILSTKLLVLEFLQQGSRPNQVIQPFQDDQVYTIQPPADMHSPNFYRLRDEISRFSKKDAYKAAIPFAMTLLKPMRKSVYDDALMLSNNIPDASNTAFWKSQILYDATVTLGQLLYKLPSSSRTKTCIKFTNNLKQATLFFPSIQNPLRAASRVTMVTHPIETKSTVTIKLLPDPYNQPQDSIPPTNLPTLYWKFEAKQNDGGILDHLMLKNTTITLSQSQKHVALPSTEHDIRLDESIRTTVRVSKQPLVAEAISNLLNMLKTPESRRDIHKLDPVTVDLPKELAITANQKIQFHAVKSGKLPVNYIFALPEIRHEVRFLHDEYPIILSTVESPIGGPDRTELSTQTRTILAKEAEKREPVAYELAKRTAYVSQAILTLVRVAKDHQILLKEEQQDYADIVQKRKAARRRLKVQGRIQHKAAIDKAKEERNSPFARRTTKELAEEESTSMIKLEPKSRSKTRKSKPKNPNPNPKAKKRKSDMTVDVLTKILVEEQAKGLPEEQ